MVLTLTQQNPWWKTRIVQQPQPDDANPNTAESMMLTLTQQNPWWKTRIVQQPQPDGANPNTAESMMLTLTQQNPWWKNVHRTVGRTDGVYLQCLDRIDG
jgi:hypothetical protein